MTLDHKCQIFQNLNGAVGEKSQKIYSFMQTLVNEKVKSLIKQLSLHRLQTTLYSFAPTLCERSHIFRELVGLAFYPVSYKPSQL